MNQATMFIKACGDSTTVLDRLGLDAGDRRNVLIVVAVISLIMLVFTEGPIPVQVAAASIFGLTSGVFFLLITLFLNWVSSGRSSS